MVPAEDQPKPTRTDNVENLEQYMLHNKGEIVQRLKLLAKDKCPVTAYFGNGLSLNTLVIDIIREMELVVLDYGVDEQLVQQLLKADRVIFKALHEGVNAQFTAVSLTKAKFQNEPVLAVPIPASMIWLQRRQFYRVRIPLGMPAWCEFRINDEKIRLKVFDISAGGLSLTDDDNQCQFEKDSVIEPCKLDLPGFGQMQIALKVRGIFKINQRDKSAGQRLGCSYHQLGMSDEATIARYIHSVEALRKRTED